MRQTYRELNADEKENLKAFKDLGQQFYIHCDAQNPSREISIAKTKIEEAVMWAVKHITK
jgi:hypothetical protein